MPQTAPDPADRWLAPYPKARPDLPPEFQAIYVEQYKTNREGETTAASLAQRLERWLHRQVARDVTSGAARSTLELGAGTLNQLPFEPAGAPYDVVEPFEALFRDSPLRARLRDIYADISEVPLDRRYERITSVAMMEHAADLPFVIARSARLLEPDGVFRAAIPAEGGFLWGLGWRMTTGLEFRLKRGLDYGVMMRHEHLNTAAEIEALSRLMFREVRISSFGLGRQLSLYRFIEARDPRLDRAHAWEVRFTA
jgi:SAM-dependent methyltransferase